MKVLLTLICLLIVPVSAIAEDQFANVEMKSIPVAGNVSVLTGAGGHIGISLGADGILMIDDQYAPLAKKIKAALAELGNETPAYLLNTHYHGDHTGTNPVLGTDSIIVAHDNVRVRLLNQENFPESGLPAITYSDEATIHFNGEAVRLVHMPRGHTDGDTVVFFEGSNVVHLGDHFFNGLFPYVDLGGGGSVDGYIGNVGHILEMITDETSIIPGHGQPVANKKDLQQYHDMLVQTSNIVRKAMQAGKSADEIVAIGLGARWESWSWQFINEERWIRTIFSSYSA